MFADIRVRRFAATVDFFLIKEKCDLYSMGVLMIALVMGRLYHGPQGSEKGDNPEEKRGGDGKKRPKDLKRLRFLSSAPKLVETWWNIPFF